MFEPPEADFATQKEHGFADDQPFPLYAGGARFISVPYSIEVNDIPAFLDRGMTAAAFGHAIDDHLELLRSESRRRPGGVLGLALHPFLINQPSRHRYLAEALARARESAGRTVHAQEA